MKTLRVKRSRLSLPDMGQQASPENYIRVITDAEGIDLESASLADLPIEIDTKTGKGFRRTAILRDVKPDPTNKDYVLCTVEEVDLAADRT